MSIRYVGKAAVWGHNSTIAATDPSTCLGSILIQSYKFKPSADTFDIMDKIGTEGRISANPKETLTLSGIFTGSNVGALGTSGSAKESANRTPSINDVVTITDAEDTEVAGKWVIADAEKSKDVKAPVSIDLTLERFPDSTGFNGTTVTVVATS